MSYLYLTKTILQLMQADPLKSQFLFTIKNKTLYITKVSEQEIKKIENPCVRSMKKTGNGWGIYFTQSILDLIDINPQKDKAEILLDEQTISVKKAK